MDKIKNMKTQTVIFFLILFLLPFQIKIYSQQNTEQQKGDNEIIISSGFLQKMQFGIDAERIGNYWHLDISVPLAELAVKEMKSDFVRVAINCAYELTEGEKDPDAYGNILDMMSAMKTANPEIKFFASPRPLWVAYNTKNGVPWSPYPTWIQEWTQNGTQKIDGKEYPKWKKGDFHVEKLVRYFADYLNLMHEQGFEISYLDLSNEQSIITPARTKFIFDNLQELLNDGVKTPEFVVPSTWSLAQGVEWLKSVDKDKNEHQAFSIAAAHNTGGEFVGEIFAEEAGKLNKKVWNSEMHGWMGVDSRDEILSSNILWKHIRAGFSGIDTWLFYGPYQGRGHTMIWVDPDKGIRKSTKYEIFKKLVNNANGGYYVHSTIIHPDLLTAAFVEEDNLTIWVLNNSDKQLENIKFNLQEFQLGSNVVEETMWSAIAPRTGLTQFIINKGKSSLEATFEPETLYYFKLKLEKSYNQTSVN
jgi:O-glycosyl hydrolase